MQASPSPSLTPSGGLFYLFFLFMVVFTITRVSLEQFRYGDSLMATASQIASAIRLSLKDINDFPGTTSDSPLKISTFKGVMDEKKYLSLDAAYRRKANEGNTTYQLPTRVVGSPKTLAEVFNPLISSAVSAVSTAKTAYHTDPATFPALEVATENAEYVIQLYGHFKALANTKVVEVSTTSEVPKTLVITGETGAGTQLDPTITLIAHASVIYG